MLLLLYMYIHANGFEMHTYHHKHKYAILMFAHIISGVRPKGERPTTVSFQLLCCSENVQI